MTETITPAIDKQHLPPRPASRADDRTRNHTSFTFHTISNRTKTAKKLEASPLLSINRQSLHQRKQYLYVQLLRRHQNHTPQPIHIKLENKSRAVEDQQDTRIFLRSRRAKLRSSARNEFFKPDTDVRPTTSHSMTTPSKMAYLDELCEGSQALKDFKILSHIGKGAFSVVSLAIGKEDNRPYAIKTYQKVESLDWNRLACMKRQIRHLKNLRNQRVVRLEKVIKERKKIHLVLENCGKYSLCGLLRKQKVLPEQRAKRVIRQILEGLSYCHENGVCHRDLKPENILIDQKGSVKIIDFGFSANSQTPLTTHCGTPAYMSPELVKKGSYIGSKADIWAMGVVMYLMMVGSLPFRASNEPELHRLISTGKYRYREDTISAGAKKMISQMLQISPDSRPSAKQLLADSWLC